MRIMFANTYDEELFDFPEGECGITDDDLSFLGIPHNDCAHPLVELKYDSDNAINIIRCWDGEIADFLDDYGQCVAGMDVGLMGDWGENHLLEYEVQTKEEVHDWPYFLNSITPLFEDFKDTMDFFNIKAFFCCNSNWYYSEQNLSMSADMYSLAVNLKYHLRRDGSGDNGPDFLTNQFNQYVLKSGHGVFLEWVHNDTLTNDFDRFYLNYCQLNMCHIGNIHQWGLDYAIQSQQTNEYNNLKNKLGYRFRVNKVDTVIYQTSSSININIFNIGYGFCSNDVRANLISISPDGTESTVKTIYLPKYNITRLRRGGSSSYTISFPWESSFGSNLAFSIDVKEERTGKWVTVPLSNYDEVDGSGNPIPAKKLKIVIQNN